MSDPLVERLRTQIGGPRDGALLRFSIGNALLGDGDYEGAATAFREAIGFDPNYSAAWKLLGKSLLARDDDTGAAEAWRQGIATANARGDMQAAKEMTVFLNRLTRKG
ncbi:tetratricopeptide repeat protein [Luteibacter sp. PPL201]|jgi:Flp pilus assembly protein TadD|uniref:Tetratricopeptide repeat protein n=1 Tax=Luteibacter sahnii TaxID=3021977 RepID=A0ABT6BDP6_9GAMM|nr:tetratricopeptide repeat protein [Luteibacter sp. PPL193]MDY1548894.1 tetratricopeptide repeat protein [Luteibacter sp. PPL193]